MSAIKLTADSGGGSVALKGPATTGSNGNRELIVPDTYSGNGSLVTADSSGNIDLAGTLDVTGAAVFDSTASFAGDITGNGGFTGKRTNNDYHVFRGQNTGGTQTSLITGAGDATFSGDLVFDTAGKGVCLGVTSNTDANTLDDYEEGTWTPAFEGSVSGSGSNTSYGAWYTKIGRVVHFYCYIVCTGLGDITGNLYVTGLPFLVHATGGYQTVNFCAATDMAITAGESLTGFCVINDDAFAVQIWNSTAGCGYIPHAELSADGAFIATGTYFTAG